MTIKYGRERIQDVFDELSPIIRAHHDEISEHKDFELKPNRLVYCSLEDAGYLRVFIARDKINQIIGYMAYLVSTHLHYPELRQAHQESVFIYKEKRGFGMQFMNWCNDQLKQEGIQFIFQQVNMNHDFGKVLKKMKFIPFSMMYMRREF